MMVAVTNPFDAGGYTMAELTTAINIETRRITRLAQLGLFRFEGITQRAVLIEQINGLLNLLPTVRLGGPATVANREGRALRSFVVPWIPHDDAILPQDIQGIRPSFGALGADPLAVVMDRKLARMRVKHEQTREFMETNALRGIVRDGGGAVVYDYFAEFGLSRTQVDFKFGTAATSIVAKAREVVRTIEDELKGETMTSVLALVSPEFFDKLTGHETVIDAYRFFTSSGSPLREDVRQRFPFGGVIFEEYGGTVTLADGATSERMMPSGEGIALPLGTTDTFVTYGAPPLHIELANTIGLPIYAQQLLREDGSMVELKTQASILPVNKRPRLAVRLFSSN